MGRTIGILEKVGMADGSPQTLVSTFVGERYGDAARLRELIAPPYDVISAAQRETYKARDEHNIVRLILPDGAEDRYGRAAATLQTWRAKGVLVRDASPHSYVVRQEYDAPDGRSYVRTGVIAGVAVDPYSSGRVRPHEKTHSGPKADRLALMRSTCAMFEALLMMAPDRSGRLREMLQAATVVEPDVRADLDGVKLSLWCVSGRSGDSIAEAAGEGGALYVADGHHRYETAGTYRAENAAADRTLALIVPVADPGLIVLPTHRLVSGTPVTDAMVRALGADWFDVSEPETLEDAEGMLTANRNRSTACVICLPGKRFFGFYLRTDVNPEDLPLSADPTVQALDIARIDALVVDNLLKGAGAGGSATRLGYEASSTQVAQAVESGEAAAGILVNPTRVEQVLAVADAGAVMPPKSTYFAPKVPSGLVTLSW